MIDQTSPTKHVEELLSMGYTMTAEFVPFSKSRNAKPNPAIKDLQINWRVTVSHKRGKFTTEYSEGIGHLPKELQSRTGGYTIYQADAIRFACEQGARPLGASFPRKGPALTPPSLADVMYSLVMDSSATDGTFEDWCGEYGYDTDSRKAEQMFTGCQNEARYLLATVGPEGLDKLRELFQDY